MVPKTSSIRLPAEYGTPAQTLPWEDVRSRLEQATQYWLSTTRPDGRPHTVPVDGLWVDDLWYFGGSPQAVHQRNLHTNSEIVVHLSDAMKAVIVEGVASWRVVASSDARGLAAASKSEVRLRAAASRLYLGHLDSRASACPRLDQLSARRDPLRLRHGGSSVTLVCGVEGSGLA